MCRLNRITLLIFIYLSTLTFAQNLIIGSTMNGGTFDNGTLFQINLSNDQFKTLLHFEGLNRGASPELGLTKYRFLAVWCY